MPPPVLSLDPESFAHNRLSTAEAARFEEQGYLIVEDALPAATVARLAAILRDMVAEKRTHGPYHADEDIRQAIFNAKNDLQEQPEVISLLTNSTVFPKIVDIMGSNIYIFHGFCPVTAAVPAGTAVPDMAMVTQFPFHRDGGLDRHRGLEFEERPSPRMTIKAIYYVSDCSEPGRGNTWVVSADTFVIC
eukprot:SAG11_NODE_10185_length_849_cov_0.613333_1_plen_189_part_10